MDRPLRRWIPLCLVVLGLACSRSASRQPFPQPPAAVEIDGVTLPGVIAVEGPVTSIEVREFREGGSSGPPRKLPGLQQAGEIVLTRQVVADSTLWDWYQQVTSGTLVRKTVSIAFERDGVRVRYVLLGAWPDRFALGSLGGGHGAVHTEEVTLTFDSAQRLAP
ncbi:MAG TPA: phage tail protein [Myxococcota bacterium]|jgi:phage tail-like protein|nr:phage tail protein [Myxococcota bacterium]